VASGVQGTVGKWMVGTREIVSAVVFELFPGYLIRFRLSMATSVPAGDNVHVNHMASHVSGTKDPDISMQTGTADILPLETVLPVDIAGGAASVYDDSWHPHQPVSHCIEAVQGGSIPRAAQPRSMQVGCACVCVSYTSPTYSYICLSQVELRASSIVSLAQLGHHQRQAAQKPYQPR
jgi:hypothetical protein